MYHFDEKISGWLTSTIGKPFPHYGQYPALVMGCCGIVCFEVFPDIAADCWEVNHDCKVVSIPLEFILVLDRREILEGRSPSFV